MKIKHENTTMCIVHSTLRDATTPYTGRWHPLETSYKDKKNIDMTEEELRNKLISLQKESENEYYENAELNRHSFLKEKLSFSKEQIKENEEKRKEDLFDWILKYKNKEKYIKLCTNDINLKYLDLIREFINLDKESLKSLEKDKISVLKEISESIFLKIPEKYIKEYKKSGKTNEKHLFFLEIDGTKGKIFIAKFPDGSKIQYRNWASTAEEYNTKATIEFLGGNYTKNIQKIKFNE